MSWRTFDARANKYRLEDPEKEKSHSEYNVQGFTFKAKETFDVSIFSDLEAVNKKASPLASGTLTLGDSVFADDETINEDPAAHTEENESKEESEIEGKPSLRLRKAAQALRITGERVESKDLRKAAILGDWHNAYQDARKEVLSKSKQEAEVVDK